MTGLLLESEPCGRCGGSGHYSFNQITGTRCFDCGGRGERLTKRGRAAQEYLDGLRQSPAPEIAVGDLIKFDFHFYAFFAPVEEIVVKENGYLDISATRKKNGEKHVMSFAPTCMVQRGFDADQKAQHREMALAYQATLTKAGTPRKKG